jgi:hypothetical protein
MKAAKIAGVVAALFVALASVVGWCVFRETGLRETESRLSNGTLSLAANKGGFYLNCYTYHEAVLPSKETWLIDFPTGLHTGERIRLMVETYPRAFSSEVPNAKSTRYIFFYTPVRNLWSLFGLCCIYPTVVAVRGPLRRYRRRKRGACLQCGYDLTGNVSGRCPECGEPRLILAVDEAIMGVWGCQATFADWLHAFQAFRIISRLGSEEQQEAAARLNLSVGRISNIVVHCGWALAAYEELRKRGLPPSGEHFASLFGSIMSAGLTGEAQEPADCQRAAGSFLVLSKVQGWRRFIPHPWPTQEHSLRIFDPSAEENGSSGGKGGGGR